MDDNFYLDLVTDAGDSDTDTGSSRVLDEDTPRWVFVGVAGGVPRRQWIWRHVPEGAGVIMTCPNGWKPSEHPEAFWPDEEVLEHLLGGPDD